MSEILEDGFSTIISFALNPAVKMEEVEVTPPGISMGGPIDISTMRNTAVRTKASRALRDYSEASLSVAYDPAIYPQIDAMAGINQLITITYPDGDTIAFWGWIEEFTPNGLTDGDRPLADLVIQLSNRNAGKVETAPVHSA